MTSAVSHKRLESATTTLSSTRSIALTDAARHSTMVVVVAMKIASTRQRSVSLRAQTVRHKLEITEVSLPTHKSASMKYSGATKHYTSQRRVSR
jgi:hypothetical protein